MRFLPDLSDKNFLCFSACYIIFYSGVIVCLKNLAIKNATITPNTIRIHIGSHPRKIKTNTVENEAIAVISPFLVFIPVPMAIPVVIIMAKKFRIAGGLIPNIWANGIVSAGITDAIPEGEITIPTGTLPLTGNPRG